MTKDKALTISLDFIERVNKDGWLLADFEPEMYAAITAIKEALAQPEQEPVAWLVTYGGLTHVEYTQPNMVVDTHYQPLYAAPPRREWVGLTDEEIEAFDTWHDNREEEVGWVNPSEILAYIEAKLKEKNT